MGRGIATEMSVRRLVTRQMRDYIDANGIETRHFISGSVEIRSVGSWYTAGKMMVLLE